MAYVIKGEVWNKLVTWLPVLSWISDGNSKQKQSKQAVVGLGWRQRRKISLCPNSCGGQGILTEMEQKQSRWGVLPGPLFSGADAGVGELWEHHPCWSCRQLCNKGSYSRITTVSGLWLATTLPALAKVTVLGDTLTSFYPEEESWVPWGSSAEQERPGGRSAPGNCWRLRCLAESPPFTSYSP